MLVTIIYVTISLKSEVFTKGFIHTKQIYVACKTETSVDTNVDNGVNNTRKNCNTTGFKAKINQLVVGRTGEDQKLNIHNRISIKQKEKKKRIEGVK